MKSRSVEHLDLSLRIPEHLMEQIQGWLDDFLTESEDVIKTPKMKSGALRMNSQDLIEFLGYVDPSQLSDVDQQRIKSLAKEQLQDNLNKAIRSEYRYHYQWCLAALQNFEWGRFINEEFRSSGS